MDLTIHLIDHHLDAARIVRLPDDERVRVQQPSVPSRWDFVNQLTVATREDADGPDWASYLTGAFELEDLRTISHSAVLIVHGAGRLFALTFGDGRTLLDNDVLLRDFGLRVTANSVEPDRLTGLGSRTVRLRPRRRTTRLGEPSDIWDFDVKLDVEWVQTLSGRPIV